MHLSVGIRAFRLYSDRGSFTVEGAEAKQQQQQQVDKVKKFTYNNKWNFMTYSNAFRMGHIFFAFYQYDQ